jgi:hypothetical protein
MNPFLNEEIAWLRLQDVQREAENRRLTARARPRPEKAALRRLFDALSGWSRRAARTRANVGLPDHHAAAASAESAD